MTATSRGLLVALTLLTACACEEVDYHGIDTFYVNRMMLNIEHQARLVNIKAQFLRVNFDLSTVAEAYGLDAYGEPLTPWRSLSTFMAPTPAWRKHFDYICLTRGGPRAATEHERSSSRCFGPSIQDEFGVMEGDLLFQVRFVK